MWLGSGRFVSLLWCMSTVVISVGMSYSASSMLKLSDIDSVLVMFMSIRLVISENDRSWCVGMFYECRSRVYRNSCVSGSCIVEVLFVMWLMVCTNWVMVISIVMAMVVLI